MKQITSPADIADLGAILSVWAHPDDESFLAAGVLAIAVRQGQRVTCVTATKGEAGSQDPKKWPPETIGEVRSAEMAQALKILGVKEHHWLGCHDGTCAIFPHADAVDKLTQIVKDFKPDTIITFGPDGWTGHDDHRTISKWVSAVVAKLGTNIAIYHVVGTHDQYELYLKEADKKINIFFNIDKPPLMESEDCAILLELPPDIQDLKTQALAAMPSQTEVLYRSFSKEFLSEAFGVEAFVRA